MRLMHWLWISGFAVAPVAGWWTAKLTDAGGSAGQVNAAQQQSAAAQDEAAKSSSDLAKLLKVIGVNDVEAAIDRYVKLEKQLSDESAARTAAMNALSKVGFQTVDAAVAQIDQLNNQISRERQNTYKTQKVVAELQAMRDSQGWQSAACPGPTTNCNQQPATAAPSQPAYVIVCYQ
jgi:hypothetical protein